MTLRPLVYIEERDGALVPGSVALLAKARDLGAEPVALLAGSDVAELAVELGGHGAAHVLVAEDRALASPLPEPRVDVVAAVVERHGFDTVLFENSALTADIAGALAARLEAGVNWDLSDLRIEDGELVGERLALRDIALVDVAWKGTPRIAVMRRGVLEPRSPTGQPAAVETIEVLFRPRARAVRIVERAAPEESTATIETAEVIVAGGRGLQAKENLALLENLADALGGAVAVTMPLVDRGWYPYAHQVGQTGRSVKPRLYIACGISGAVQHRVGMEKSAIIIAINTDPSAPVFGFCDVGVVGDALEIVPHLTELVRRARGSYPSRASSAADV